MGQTWENTRIEALEDELLKEKPGREETRAPIVDLEAIKRIWGETGYRVFLSHRSNVRKNVGLLKEEMETFGAKCFVAHRDIKPTRDFQDEMVHALRSMHCLIAVITGDFHESEWTDQEIGFAMARGIPIVALMLDQQSPRGFICRYQALSCEWETAPIEALKILINEPGMFVAYVARLRDCNSWDNGNKLAKLLPGITKLSRAQIDELVDAFNGNGQLQGSFAFNGTRWRDYGHGLVHYINNLGKRTFELRGGRISKVKAT